MQGGEKSRDKSAHSGSIVCIHIDRVVIRCGEISTAFVSLLDAVMERLTTIERKADRHHDTYLEHFRDLRRLIMALSDQSAQAFAEVGDLIADLGDDVTAKFQAILDQNSAQHAEVDRLNGLITNLQGTIADMQSADTAEDAAFTAQIADLSSQVDTLVTVRDNLQSQLDGQDGAVGEALNGLRSALKTVDDQVNALGTTPAPAPEPTPEPSPEPPVEPPTP